MDTEFASGAQVDAVDDSGDSPLHLAARWGSHNVTLDLIAAGA